MSPSSANAWRKNGVLAYLASLFGTFMDAFELMAVASLLPFLTKVFLPQTYPPIIGSLLTLFALSVSLIFRPVGALIFGHFADRLGRLSSMVAVFVVMGLGFLLTGLLPSYSTAGYLSFALFLLLRAVVGIGIGGEYSSGTPFALEWSPKGWRGFVGGSMDGVFAIGAATTGSITLAVYSLVGPKAMVAYGWRYVFFIGALVVAAGLAVRLSLAETPSFTALKASGGVERSPIRSIFSGKDLQLTLIAFLTSTGALLAYYSLAPTITLILTLPPVDLSPSAATLAYTASALSGAASCFIFGTLSQLLGRRRTAMALALATALASLPLSSLLVRASSLSLIILLASLRVFLEEGIIPIMRVWITEMFPTGHRGTGFGFGFSSGLFIGGLFSVWIGLLHQLTSAIEGPNIWLSSGILASVGAALAVAGFALGPETLEREL